MGGQDVLTGRADFLLPVAQVAVDPVEDVEDVGLPLPEILVLDRIEDLGIAVVYPGQGPLAAGLFLDDDVF